MFGSPLTRHQKPKKEVDPRVEWKKMNKVKIPPGLARKLTGRSDADPQWCQRWLEQFRQERLFPMSLVSSQALEVLMKSLPLEECATVVETLRREYDASHPLGENEPQSSPIRSLLQALKSRAASRTCPETTEEPTLEQED